MKLNLIRSLIALFALATVVSAGSTASQPDSGAVIRDIKLHGNRVTRDTVILQYIPLRRGDAFDSARVARAEKTLQRLSILSRAHITPIIYGDSVDLHCIVQEAFLYSIPLPTISIIDDKYGENTPWLYFRLGVRRKNFRGLLETLSFDIAFPEAKELCIKWFKPFLGSPYFFSGALRLQDYPDQKNKWRHSSVSTALGVGRRLLKRSTLYFAAIPTYNLFRDVEFDGKEYVPTDSLPYRELLLRLRLTTQNTEPVFNPQRGWSLSTSVQSNHLYHYLNRFFQFDISYRLYRPGFNTSNTWALGGRLVTRSDNGGEKRKLYVGGDRSLRGFKSGQLGSGQLSGHTITGNNTLTASLEYRFKLFHLQNLPQIEHEMNPAWGKNLDGGVYGTVFVDGGYVWESVLDPDTNNEYGVAVGTGLRFLTNLFEAVGSIDGAIGLYPSLDRSMWYYSPTYHLYSGFHF